MRIETDVKLDFDDVLIRPKRSESQSRQDVSLERTYLFRNSGAEWSGIPIIASNMDSTGTFEMAQVFSQHKMLTGIHKFYSAEEWKTLDHKIPASSIVNHVIPSSGSTSFEELFSIMQTLEFQPRFIMLDVANGYTEHFVNAVMQLRAEFPKKIIIAGNVATSEMTEQLILAGADIVKIGIGPGSACTTRLVTGVGYPQLSAIIECADAAHGLGGHIIADGGCRTPGDVAKAFAANADFVMLGGMLAGSDEAGGKLIEDLVDPMAGITKRYKQFYGMSSTVAQQKYYGKQKGYRASEGRVTRIPATGPVATTIQEVLGGLRSALTYVGARHLKELSKCTTFVRVTATHNKAFEAYTVK